MIIKRIYDLKRIVSKLKKQRKKIVFTNGCFDILHSAHIDLFKFCKKQGDVLILGVNSDKSIQKIKGKGRPIIKQKDRIKILDSIKHIDYIYVFKTETPFKLIKNIIPNILVKGGDYKAENIVGADIVLKNRGKVKIFKYKKGLSTSLIIERILKLYG